MRKIEKWSGKCSVERDRTRDTKVLKPGWCEWPLLPSEPMVMSQTASTEGHVCASGLTTLPMLMFMAHVTTRGHTDVYNLHHAPTWSHVDAHGLVLSLGAILLEAACTTIWGRGDICGLGCLQGPCLGPLSYWGHVCVSGLCCCQTPCGGPWSVLPLTVKSKESTLEAILMIADI